MSNILSSDVEITPNIKLDSLTGEENKSASCVEFIGQISYKPFRLLLAEYNIRMHEIRAKSGLSSGVFTKIYNDKPLTLEVIIRLSEALSNILKRPVRIQEICNVEYKIEKE